MVMGITQLKDVVLVLAARTRRSSQPFVYIDLDVFTPDDRRAVEFQSPTRDMTSSNQELCQIWDETVGRG